MAPYCENEYYAVRKDFICCFHSQIEKHLEYFRWAFPHQCDVCFWFTQTEYVESYKSISNYHIYLKQLNGWFDYTLTTNRKEILSNEDVRRSHAKFVLMQQLSQKKCGNKTHTYTHTHTICVAISIVGILFCCCGGWVFEVLLRNQQPIAFQTMKQY